VLEKGLRHLDRGVRLPRRHTSADSFTFPEKGGEIARKRLMVR